MRTINLPAIGSFIQDQGGYLGAILRGPAADGSEDFAVIVPEEEGAELKDVTWSDQSTKIEGADSKIDGPANTAAMVAAGLPLALHIRDRIVHHLLYNRIAPRFHAAFTADSCACIPGRGTLYGAQRLEHQVRSITRNWSRPAHYLKCDCANFFISIDKLVLRERLARRVHEPWWLALTDTILFHDPRQDVEVRGNAADLRRVPPHKSLFNAPADTGLPIGNLSSQFFANVLLDALDQFAKHRLRAPHYVRYVDDFVLLHPSPQWLAQALQRIQGWLPQQLHLQLNPRKTVLQPVARGIDFVGHVIKPWRRTTRPRTLRTALQRLEHMPASETYAAGNSYLGLVRQATHSHKERAAIARALLKRGHAVEGLHLSKAFPHPQKGSTA